MSSLPAEVPTPSSERRGAERRRVACPAQLQLTTGVRVGLLWDLSSTGARIQLADPPRMGTQALLRWQSYDAFCEVVWITDDMCGLVFDRPLKPSMLDETLVEDARRSGPAASVRNIPLGPKRSCL